MVATDVLSLPASTYLLVLGLAVAGGLVGLMNKAGKYKFWDFFKAAATSAFTGFLAFCACFEAGAAMGMTLFAVGVAGLMGKRAWDDMESIFRMRAGLPPKAPDTDTARQSDEQG
jgi:hypothetical protein